MNTLRQIKSLIHPTVKRLVKLRKDRNFRLKEGRAVVLGQKLCTELRPYIKEIFSSEPEGEETLVTHEILKKIAGVPAPDQKAAEVELPKQSDLTGSNRLLICDNIQDPGNLGTLIRTALAFHFDGVILTPGCVDIFNEKVIRSSKGACFKLPHSFQSLESLPHTLYCGDLSGTPLPELSAKAPFALIVSNEGAGPSPEMRSRATPVTIPMHDMAESLNVAVAGSIMMHHLGGAHA